MRKNWVLWVLMSIFVIMTVTHFAPVATTMVETTVETTETVIEPDPPPEPDITLLPPDPNDPGVDPTPYMPGPLPEDVVYDATEPSGTIPYTFTDPETGETSEGEVFKDEISVRFVPEVMEEDIDAVLASVSGWKKIYDPAFDVWTIGIPPASSQQELDSKLETLNNNPLVEFAVPSVVGKPTQVIPNDPLYVYQGNPEGNLARIKVPFAWEIEKGVNEVVIGILDSGVRSTHEDLAPKFIRQYGLSGYSEPHGTIMASIAAAATNNSVGMAGVGWNTRFVSGRVTNSSGKWSGNLVESRLKDFINTYDPAPILITNMSFVVFDRGYTDGMKFATLEAWKREILLVASAGNVNGNIIARFFPAHSFTAMTVGGMWWRKDPSQTDSDEDGFYYWRMDEGIDFASAYQNEGERFLSVMAPWRTGVWASVESDSAYYFSYLGLHGGTSSAAAHTSGLAALVLSQFPSMSNLDIKHRLEDTADDRVRPDRNTLPISGYDRFTGWGRVDAERAVKSDGPLSMTLSSNRWYMVCLPIWPKRRADETDWRDSAAAWRFFPTPYLYRLIPGTNSYANVAIDLPSFGYYPSVHLVRPYQSFWVWFSGNTDVTVIAEGARAGLKDYHELEIPLRQGFNMLGNPFSTDLPWDDTHVSVRFYKVKVERFLFWRIGVSETSNIVPLSQAISNGWLRDKIALWNPTTNSYEYVDDNLGQSVPPGRGFLLRANRDNLTLLIKSPPTQ